MADTSALTEIHEYCDRWCDECSFQQQCSLVQCSPSEDLGETLASLLSPSASPEHTLSEHLSAFQVEHPLADETLAWFWRVHDWLGTCFVDTQSSDERALRVSWHASIVLTKVSRAVSRGTSSTRDRDLDALGSAKVATLSLGKILDVLMHWCPLHQRDRQALRLLHNCSQLLDSIESTFPGHLHILRPGLDAAGPPRMRRIRGAARD